MDEFSINEEQIFERRSGGSAVARGNLAPSSMQWAIRTREPPTIRSSNTAGLVFIDHASGTMRRSAASTVAAAAAAAANADPVTMATTAHGLARAFGIIMRYISFVLCYADLWMCHVIELLFREIGDLLKYIQDYPSTLPRLPRKLEVSQEDVNNLQEYLDRRLVNVWEWLLRVMDSTESQVRIALIDFFYHLFLFWVLLIF